MMLSMSLAVYHAVSVCLPGNELLAMIACIHRCDCVFESIRFRPSRRFYSISQLARNDSRSFRAAGRLRKY